MHENPTADTIEEGYEPPAVEVIGAIHEWTADGGTSIGISLVIP